MNKQISKFIVNITKSKYLDQDAGDGLQSNHYHCVEIHQSAAQFEYILHEIGNRVRGVAMDLNTSEWNVTAGSVLMPGRVDLQKFML